MRVIERPFSEFLRQPNDVVERGDERTHRARGVDSGALQQERHERAIRSRALETAASRDRNSAT